MTLVSPEFTLDPTHREAGDVTHFWRVQRHHGLDCLRATFRRHAYARHSHETYAIAGITGGCETFFHRGEQHYAETGSIAVVCPDEVHDGEPHGDSFEYRTIYPSAALMHEIAEDITGRPLSRPPWFAVSVLQDPSLMTALTRLHASLGAAEGWVTEMEQDTRLVDFLARLVARWGDMDGPSSAPEGHRGIGRARDYIEAHLGDDIELCVLAGIAGLSRSHFIRAFQKETGLAPHAYLTDRRFRRASRLLGRGDPPGDVALSCGFFDQSHLNRVFKARMGVTPGVYRAA
ncbi:AraC family transcriptional regulator [Microvirga pudoricolor]|uniref:AraC family transcriptional regulator n=1 Tax=Microvirga pudoricolor TaxID=2778729 RepID=UPI001952222F|nr:AraC family transcriptional regulator [Microvirga pudoricolor]MBM6595909.1 AraC family transcriptional regulator [Microvirga pudoricolor]